MRLAKLGVQLGTQAVQHGDIAPARGSRSQLGLKREARVGLGEALGGPLSVGMQLSENHASLRPIVGALER